MDCIPDLLENFIFYPTCTSLQGLPFSGRPKELPLGIPSELMTQDSKTSRCVSEALGGFGTGEPLHVVGPQSLILAMGRVGRLQKDFC